MRKKRIRPQTIAIPSKRNLSYTEILKMVKTDGDLKDVGSNVSKIRRTAVKANLGKTN